MTIYGFTMEDGADAMWALYGSAIRIGQNLGLNRLEAEERGKTWPPLWSTRMQREMGRRVWWTFAALDWSHASSHGGIYCIHPSQNFTALPANLDDDRLDDDGAELPLDVYTPISMQIFRFKFVTLYREVTDHMATRKIPSYPFIMRMDSELMISAHGLPSHFKNPDKLPLDMPNQVSFDVVKLADTPARRRLDIHQPHSQHPACASAPLILPARVPRQTVHDIQGTLCASVPRRAAPHRAC
jgi:hypothetical protein